VAPITSPPSTAVRILDAAERCMRRDGVGQVSMAVVAAEAGMSRGSIYNAFGDRAALVDAVLARVADRFVASSEVVVDRRRTLIGQVAEAAVFGIKHPKWQERPLACVVVKDGDELTRDEVLEFLDGKVAKWWLPDDVVFVDEIPKTSVGKFSKKDLRAQFADYELPSA